MAKKHNYTRREVMSTLGATVLTASAVVNLPTEGNAEAVAPASSRVMRYGLAWNTRTNTGIVYLYLQGVTNRVRIAVPSLDQFSGYLAILKEEPVFYDSRGWLYTGSEEVG